MPKKPASPSSARPSHSRRWSCSSAPASTATRSASGETNNHALIDAVAQTKKPVIVSTGMSDYSEIAAAADRVRSAGAPLGILQCTSAYPCPPERLGLNVISELRQRHPDAGIGLSDHSGTIYSGLGAAAAGIELIEMHIAFSREMFGPDVGSSLTPEDLDRLVEGIRFLEASRAHPIDKDSIPEDIAVLRKVFTKSVVLKRDLAAGSVPRRVGPQRQEAGQRHRRQPSSRARRTTPEARPRRRYPDQL